jgi:hypothetical protein
METTLIYLIAKNCQWLKTVNEPYKLMAESRIKRLESLLPSGSGIDSGCKILSSDSGKDKVKISFSFHHLNDGGFYDGWTDHILTVNPTLTGIELNISGKNKNDIKDYLYQVFEECLNEITEEL